MFIVSVENKETIGLVIGKQRRSFTQSVGPITKSSIKTI